jgi:hypothetical protein
VTYFLQVGPPPKASGTFQSSPTSQGPSIQHRRLWGTFQIQTINGSDNNIHFFSKTLLYNKTFVVNIYLCMLQSRMSKKRVYSSMG